MISTAVTSPLRRAAEAAVHTPVLTYNNWRAYPNAALITRGTPAKGIR